MKPSAPQFRPAVKGSQRVGDDPRIVEHHVIVQPDDDPAVTAIAEKIPATADAEISAAQYQAKREASAKFVVRA